MLECTRDFFSLNGQLRPVADFDRYFTKPEKYLYEVLRVHQQLPLFIFDHLDRLWLTAKFERVSLPFTRQQILEVIFSVIKANPGSDGNIKIYIDVKPRGCVTWMVYFNPHQYPTRTQFIKGVDVGLFSAERFNPNAKVMDTLLRSATDQAKTDKHVYEVLLFDRNNSITEGSRSNVFFILNQKLLTPPVHTVLEGITRKYIIQICAENHISVSEKNIHINDLSHMDAVFITGTSRRVLPVRSIDKLVFDVSHILVRKLQRLFEERVKSYLQYLQTIKNPDLHYLLTGQ
ncbi:MAG TPA: hypothetical protein ENN08_01955 [Bacteroidales bacterium]|nr:hypothetical protein [Bacteroidales bacterium]